MKIKLTENKLKQIVSESIKNILSEARKPKDAYFGGYFFEGIGFDINGNPIYCSEHLPIEAKKQLGWRKSAKYGMRGQADEWVVPHVLKELGLPFGNDNEEEYYNSLNESALKQIVAESVKRVLKEEVTTMYGYDSEENPDYIEGEGYFQNDENDYWGNWAPANNQYEYIDHNYIPKNARYIAQICEKYVEDILKRCDVLEFNGISTTAELSDGDLIITMYVDAPSKNGGYFQFNAGRYSLPIYQDISNDIIDILKRRLKHFGVADIYGTSQEVIKVKLENFADKNGVENVERGRGRGTKDPRDLDW